MTFEQTKDLLQDIKKAKQRVRRINEQIAEYASIQSSLNGSTGRGKGSVLSPVESVVLRLEKERVNLATAVQSMFDLEDKLSEAIQELSTTEQDIIIGHYMNCKSHEKLAEECYYSVVTIKRKKKAAISKISRLLKDDTP